MFGDVLDRKLTVLVYKNVHLKKAQNLHFSKRVTGHGFGQKFEIFSFLAKNRASEGIW